MFGAGLLGSKRKSEERDQSQVDLTWLPEKMLRKVSTSSPG